MTVSSLSIFQMKALARKQKCITSLKLLNFMANGLLSLPDRWEMDKEAEVQHREAINDMVHWSATKDMKVG